MNYSIFLQVSFPADHPKAHCLIRRFLQGPKIQKFSPQLRAFALTLHFYSAKAYNYVRDTFNKSLPHPRTLSRWYQSVDGSPGFTKEAFNALKFRAEESAKKGRTIFCNLVMDEMAIRKLVEWTGKKYTGFVDFGYNIGADNRQEAKEALVFLLVAINDFFKVPVAYFLTNGLCAQEKADLVNRVLEFIHGTGIVVTSLTFDGAVTNLNMAKILGINLEEPSNLTTHFKHPITGDNIFVFLDPCHMLKLWRNCLASQSTLQDGEGKIIEWRFFEKLVNLQNIQQLHLGTKIRNRHLMWTREKMKVNIAAQTFSNSVADAFIYLEEDLKHPDFLGAGPTAQFTKNIDHLFDIFNVRNRFSKRPFRKPFSQANEELFLNFLQHCSTYIKNLKLRGTCILNTNRKTGFLGFLISIESLKCMYFKYCKGDNSPLKYLLTYKFSQDHIEILFSAIRSKGGSNNNPSAKMFEAIYKRLLIRSEIKGSDTANAISFDYMPILHCSSRIICNADDGTNLLDSEEYARNLDDFKEHNYAISNMWHLTTYVEDVVSYVAGFVLKGLHKVVTCTYCLQICTSNNYNVSKLQSRKTFGNLNCASKFLTDICKYGEQALRYFKLNKNIFDKNFNSNILINFTIQRIPLNVYNIFGDHFLDHGVLENHSGALTKLILRSYFKIRIHYECSKINDKTENKLRSMYTKTILFKNQ